MKTLGYCMPIVTINSNNHNELDRWCPKGRIVVLDTISYYVEISGLKTCGLTSSSYLAGWPYPRKGCPGIFIHGGMSSVGDSAACAVVTRSPERLPTATSPATWTAPVRKARRSRRPRSATGAGSAAVTFLCDLLRLDVIARLLSL